LESVLVVENDHKLTPALLELLKKEYKVYIADDIWDGETIKDEHNVDVIILLLSHHIESDMWTFLETISNKKVHPMRVIFVSEQFDEKLYPHFYKNFGWLFTSYPVKYQELNILIKKSERLTNTFNKTIKLEKRGYEDHIKVRDVVRVKRVGSSVRVYYLNHDTDEEETGDYFFPHGLAEFPKKHGIGKHLKQASQSWLLNPDYIKSINFADMEIVLTTKEKVPTSKQFVVNFTEKYKEK